MGEGGGGEGVQKKNIRERENEMKKNKHARQITLEIFMQTKA